ncbi:hypothetical protein EV182_006943, partial [Spiromyces aspiralis]
LLRRDRTRLDNRSTVGAPEGRGGEEERGRGDRSPPGYTAGESGPSRVVCRPRDDSPTDQGYGEKVRADWTHRESRAWNDAGSRPRAPQGVFGDSQGGKQTDHQAV